MIKATIAGEHFVLPSLKDAELLLQILERAKPVGAGYLGSGATFREVLYASRELAAVSVAIVADAPIMAWADYAAQRDADDSAKAAKTAPAVPA